MKRRIAMLLMLAAVLMLLSGCGMMIVEDSQPIQIGMENPDRTLTERC